MLAILISFISAVKPVVSDNDILMTKQTWGQTQRDKSVEGNPLTISGVTYSSGIGTHATSMIPITVPSSAKTLTGGCGIDDEVSTTPQSTASVIFRILSGSEVIWSSDVMHKGDGTVFFSVDVPAGAKKLYLLADEYDTNSNDHADWVNLNWIDYSPTDLCRSNSARHLSPLTSDTFEDQGPIIRRMISVARSNPGSTILLEKGNYHFYSSGALKMSFHTSNHDQPTFQPVGIPLVDLENITLDCSGSTFYFHNRMQPFLILDSVGVTVKNVHIDYWRPYVTEATVVKADYFSTQVRINKTLYPYHVENSRFVFEGEGFTLGPDVMLLFEKGTKRIINGSSSAGFSGSVTENSDGTATFTKSLVQYNLKEGDVLGFKSASRPYPAMVIYRATKTTLDNVLIHSSQGMALLAQRSDTIHLINSGASYVEGRYVSSTADATHFSNCKGQILVENGHFEGMMDDAINVHSTSLKITEVINKSYIKLQYVHGQSVGFETFLPGEKVQFIRSKTLETDEIRNVSNVVKHSTNELYLSIEGTLPENIGVGDAVENAVYYPSVTFRNNTVRNNCARGCLFTTPKDVLVENNYFDYTSGSALLLAGDAANWYESGSCKNVIIRNNRIVNALTSSYQFTRAIFSFTPTIGDIVSQKKSYHANVRIEGNEIVSYDVPLLYSISAENVEFINNKINYNSDFPSWKQKPFQFNKVKNITISGNVVTPAKTFTMEDVSLENTDGSEIHFN